MPDFSVRPAEGSNLKVLAFLFAIAVTFAAGDAKAGAKAGAVLDDPKVDVGLTQQVVADPVSGVAIAGYDPVAYFVTGGAVHGSADHEAIYAGAAWRFANQGNLEAFLADPDVYMPRYGGYDAGAVARGIATPGNPHLFAISGDRLLLFRTEENRAEFLRAPERLIASDTAWPGIAQRLIR